MALDPPAGAPARGLRAVPGGVWALGFVSLFMDVSSEMIHALLPLFLVTSLGASTLTVGLLEGVAEATASITKIFSGALSDALGRRKGLVALGYGLAAATKPLFALAPTIGWIWAARFADRVGKGIRGAPRDALIGELSPPEVRGASYGLRQSLDTVGALLGPGLAAVAMIALAGDFRAVFWLAAVPAAVSVLLILVGVREPDRPESAPRPLRSPIAWSSLRALGSRFWSVVAFAGVLTLARPSEAFLVLRAQSVGVQASAVPLFLVAMNAAYALSAYPAGRLSDTQGRRRLLFAGFGLLAASEIVLALAGSAAAVGAGALLWGLHLGLTQGIFSALVADAAPPELRGTAFGIFHLVTGLALLGASAVAGALWHAVGPAATFGAAAALVVAGLTAGSALRRVRAPAA